MRKQEDSERYSIGHLYTINVQETGDGVSEIVWRYNAEKEKRFGEYIIPTSRSDLAEIDISGIHRTLTMIEAAFSGLNPILAYGLISTKKIIE